MPVYVEMAEGLVKPLVILPAAVMPLLLLSLFSHNVIIPFVLTDSFILLRSDSEGIQMWLGMEGRGVGSVSG